MNKLSIWKYLTQHKFHLQLDEIYSETDKQMHVELRDLSVTTQLEQLEMPEMRGHNHTMT